MNYFQLIPVVVEVIKAVEKLMPEGGKSTEKLAAARALLEAVYGELADNWPKIEALIEFLVGLFNKTGVFKK